MDKLHPNEMSSEGGMMAHVFKTRQHKSNLKQTVIELLVLFHLGNCLTTICVAQTSSSISIEFDACVVIPCGILRLSVISRLELRLYICVCRPLTWL
jgi:3-polyprenyl-4-hydroxybenzoate decarboxylase